MNDADMALAMSTVDKRDFGYFLRHSLAGSLAEVGAASDMQAVRSLTWRLIKDEEFGRADAIAAGLREAAAGDDEFVRMASAAARMVRCDFAEGPVVTALVDTGKSHPDVAVSVAERLVELGDADYAGYLIGAAYGGAAARCDAAIGLSPRRTTLKGSWRPCGPCASRTPSTDPLAPAALRMQSRRPCASTTTRCTARA